MAPSGDDSVVKSHCSEEPCAYLPRHFAEQTNFGTTESEFFDRVLADLRSMDKSAKARVIRLVKRYVPTGPQGDSADAWDQWWKENQSFAFASDAGDYRWYIDPLAKRRGVSILEITTVRLTVSGFAGTHCS
jgi:hypothetical protein